MKSDHLVHFELRVIISKRPFCELVSSLLPFLPMFKRSLFIQLADTFDDLNDMRILGAKRRRASAAESITAGRVREFEWALWDQERDKDTTLHGSPSRRCRCEDDTAQSIQSPPIIANSHARLPPFLPPPPPPPSPLPTFRPTSFPQRFSTPNSSVSLPQRWLGG